jgi:hypothetical protein
MDIRGLRVLKADRRQAEMLECIKQEADLFNIGVEHSTRLKEALGELRFDEIYPSSLLNQYVHTKISNYLFNIFIKRWHQVKDIKGFNENDDEHNLADSHLRSFTLLGSMVALDKDEAIKASFRLKQEFMAYLATEFKNISICAAIECEVISMDILRGIKDAAIASDDEMRKLATCEILSAHMNDSFDYKIDDNKCLFSIHIHGFLMSPFTSDFYSLKRHLTKHPDWSKCNKQFLMKKISRSCGKVHKAVEDNIKDYIYYFTKGGNDWCAGNKNVSVGRVYYRYKVGYNSRGFKAYKQQLIKINDVIGNKGKDVLGMTKGEIVQLALTIQGIMRMTSNKDTGMMEFTNKNGTGFALLTERFNTFHYINYDANRRKR